MYLQCIDLSAVKKDGYWDEAALLCCKKELKKRLEEDGYHSAKGAGGRDGLSEKLKDWQQEVKRIGSGLYRKMFAESRYSPSVKAMLPIRQMGGILDEYEMLQLTYLKFLINPDDGRLSGMEAREGGYCFDSAMEPNSAFLEDYARTVVGAYGDRGLDSPEVHQFRMYIDFHNICYIRTKFEGTTDLQRLLAYAKETGQPLDFHSSSRLHNRKLRKNLGIFERQVNDKIKSRNGLSEFIVRMRDDRYGPAGQFVTQWDYLKADKKKGRIDSNPEHYTIEEYKPIVETESFNYCKNDRVRIGEMKRLHTLLDVEPANGKTGYENALKKEGKKYWAADRCYKEQYTGNKVMDFLMSI